MSMTPSRRTLESLTIADMAIDDRIYIVRCNLCRTTDNYMATDLEAIYGGATKAYALFIRCRHCGKSEYLNVSTRLPMSMDVGKLRVRRPAGEKVVRLWNDGLFEFRPPSGR